MALQFTFVIRRLILMDDPLGRKAVQVSLDFAKKLLRLSRILGLAKLLDHRTNLAPMVTVARAPPGILPDTFGG